MKRRFDFRLERVRRVRELEEQIARTEWGEAQAEANQAAAELERRRAELEATRGELRALLQPREEPSAIDPRAMSLVHDLLDQQAHGIRRADEEMLTKQAQADRLAQSWREKDARRKALERLEDLERQSHSRELEREDGKEADERTSHAHRTDEGR